MASEEIKLVGKFEDGITKDLLKLDRTIQNIGRSFKTFSQQMKKIPKQFGKMADAGNQFNEALRTQQNLLQSNARALKEYRKQQKKMIAGMRGIQGEHDKMMRAQGLSRAEQKRAARGKSVGGGGSGRMPGMPLPSSPSFKPKAPKVPKSRAPKAAPAPIPAPAPVPIPAPAVPKPRSKPKGKIPAQQGTKMGEAAGQGFMKSVASTAIGVGIANAFGSAVSGMKNLLMAPFNKFGDMFAERVRDEMDDIKSAGGLFALDMDLTQASGNERFFKNYNESLRFQEKLNIDMAESAASLPGVTSQYVDTSRQLTDTIQMVMEKDRGAFQTLAQQFGANTAMGGVDADKAAFQTILKKQTEQVMLQSQGQTGGLPMHIAIQQLMNKEAKNGKIGMQAFTNKFRAAFQKNPLLKNFLMRAEDEMAKTEVGSAERLKVIMETFDAAMPKEVVNKMRGSLSGMQEALRSGLFDPQAGLFGMGRANIDPATGQKLMKKNVDDLGNILFKVGEGVTVQTEEQVKKLEALNIKRVAGESLKGAELTAEQLKDLGLGLNVVGDEIKLANGQVVGEVSKSTTYVFEQIREIMAGFGPPLLEFVGFLPQLFDPFGNMTKSLMDFRDQAQAFINGFNKKLDILEKDALNFSESDDAETKGMGAKLKGQSRARAAFSTVAETLRDLGGIDEDLFKSIQKITGDTTFDGIKAIEDGALNKVVGPLIESFLNSDLVRQFAKIGGLVAGGIAKAMVDVVKIFTGGFKGKLGNNLFDGFREGIQEAFGGMSMGEITKILTEAINAVFLKISDILINDVLPFAGKMVIDGLVGLVMSGNPVGLILGALGLKAIGGMLFGAVKGLTGGATAAAKAMSQAAVSAQAFSRSLGGKAAGLGGQKSQAAMAGGGIRSAGIKAKNFFLGDIKKAKGLKAIAKSASGVGAKAGGGMGGAARAMEFMGKGISKAVGAGLKSGLKMGAVGGILKAGLGLMEGKSPLDAISEGLASAGGSAIGAAIGTIIFPGIGTAIGAMIGGLLGDIQPVVDTFKGAILGLVDGFKAIIAPIGAAFGDIIGIVGELANIFLGLFGVTSDVTNGFDFVSAAATTIKIALTPLVALLNGISFLLGAFRLGLAQANKFFTNLDPRNRFNKDLQKKLDQNIADAGKSMDDAAKRQQEWNENIFKKVGQTGKAAEEAAEAMKKLGDQAKAAGSTFENNKKFTGEDGKDYGWAMKDGKKILVEWGSVASTQIKKVGEASKNVLEQQKAAAKKLEDQKKKQADEALKATVDNSTNTADETINMLRQGYKKATKVVGGQGGKEQKKEVWTKPDVGASASPASKDAVPVTPVEPSRGKSPDGIGGGGSKPPEPEHKVFEFKSVNDGIQEVAGILNSIYETLKAPEPTPIEPAAPETAAETGPNILGAAVDVAKAATNPVGFLMEKIGGALFGNNDGAAAETALPDLTEPITQVGQVATEVGAITEPMNALGTAVQTTTPPLTDLGPAADDATSAMETFVSAMQAIPPKVDAALVGAATTAGVAINIAAQGLALALSSAAQSIKNAAQASANVQATSAGGAYSGHTGGQGTKTMPLAAAIEKEKQMMPSGADLLIANTSETVIPAYAGHVGDSFKDLSFNQMESAAGFNRMKTYTEQIAEIADKTAADFSGMAGGLGGGSATLQAMEALGNKNGLTTTSGFRPGDPGFHGADRARDLSDGSGETPGMNKVANIMASQFGSSLTELIYTPLGYSIKNGQKTGLISPDNHYHHIHVAVAEGLSKAAVFSSQQAAEAYERSMMPVGAEPMKVNLASMTANSSEFSGGGDVNIGDINIEVSGVDDPKEIANKVADEILGAIKQASYQELFTN